MKLLTGNETNLEKIKQVERMVRKQNHEYKFNEIIIGKQEQLVKYCD